jgi:hypothetical protein
MFFPAVKFYVLWTVIKTLKVIPIDLKCWIRIRIETSADPQHWSCFKFFCWHLDVFRTVWGLIFILFGIFMGIKQGMIPVAR